MPEEQALPIDTISGGLLNPLANEQIRLELPEIAPAPILPGSSIPSISGNYSDNLSTPLDYAKALKNHMENPESYAQDQYKYGKNYAYDADYTGANFQRYYNSPKIFKQVGFSPWRDNEKIYNQQMNWWDSFKRAGAQSGHLFSTGFSSMLPWNAWDGDSTDQKSAVEMERAHMIGADNRGGVGAFFNNLVLDSGYTFGIGAEFAAEEIGIWAGGLALSPLTGGTSLAASATESAIQSARAISLLDKLKNLGTLGRTINKSWEGFKALKDVNRVRDIFNNVKAGKPLEKILEILTPGTFEWAKDTYKLSKNGENIYNLARASKGVGAFYRDSREIAAVLSESKLEGGSEELRLRDQLTNSFYRDNGRMPSADEYQEIFQYAQNAGRETYLWNLPALWISNKIVFDKAFRGIRPLQSFRKELSEGLAGKLAFDEAAAKAGKEAWSITKEGLKDRASSLLNAKTYAPRNLLRNVANSLLTYGKANITEALQEQYQDAISSAMNDYYTDRYNHPGQTAAHGVWGAFKDRIKEQFTTKQGWETFASGFLMGSLVQFPQHIIYEKIPEKFYQYSDPEGYQKFKEQKEQRTNDVVTALNEITKDPKKFFNPNTYDAVSQAIANDHSIAAGSDGDIKGFIDITDESTFEHLHTLLKTGKLDLIKDYLNDMRSLSGSELEEAYGKLDPNDGNPKDFYSAKIDSMIARADDIQKRYEYIDNEYGNPFNPSKYSPAKDNTKYNEEVYKWEAWEEAKKLAVFSSYSFDRTLDRMNDVLKQVTTDKPLGKASASDFSILFDQNQIDSEVKFLREEVKVLSSIDGSKREAAKKLAKLETLKEYRDTISEYQFALSAKSDSQEKVSESLKGLYKAYKNYLKVIANQSEDIVFTSKLNSSFVNIKDFYHLQNDSRNMADVINMLHNPESFSEYAKRAESIKRGLHENRTELFRKSFSDKQTSEELNDLLNQIYELGAFFYPNEIEAFRSGQLPSSFYDVTSGDKISETSDKYKQITDLLEKYEQTHDISFVGKDIAGSDQNKAQPRNKVSDDTRSYRDIAKEYGFDPTGVESQVPISELLNKISKSSFSTYREKALARRLATIRKPEQSVTFKNDHPNPGSYDQSNGMIIDARFSSRDYKNGNLPIEYTILHTYIHSLIDNGLDTDKQFSDNINNLLRVSTDYYSSPDIRSEYGNIPVYGLTSPYEFIAEAMTNERFQVFLQNIPFETTGESLWTNFRTSVRRFLSRILGTNNNNTVLNEALNIITLKIDSTYIGDSTSTTEEVSPDLPDELTNRLLQSYKSWNRERLGRNEELTDPMVFEKSDEQIIASDSFKEYTKLPGKPGTIISNYNKAQPKNTPVTQDIEEPGIKIVGWKMKQSLMNLGYDRSEVNRMPYTEAVRIISGNIPKGQEDKIRQEEELLRQQTTSTKQANAINSIREQLDKIRFVSDLDDFYNALRDAIKDTNLMEETGLNSDMLSDMIEAKRKELSIKVSFEELNPGEVVMMKDSKYGKMVVISKNNDEVKFRKYGEPSSSVIVIKKNNIESNIIYKDRPNAETLEATEIKEADKVISNKDLTTASSLNDTESIIDDINKARQMSEEDLDNELVKNIGCKK